jgi:hypothetical protein
VNTVPGVRRCGSRCGVDARRSTVTHGSRAVAQFPRRRWPGPGRCRPPACPEHGKRGLEDRLALGRRDARTGVFDLQHDRLVRRYRPATRAVTVPPCWGCTARRCPPGCAPVLAEQHRFGAQPRVQARGGRRGLRRLRNPGRSAAFDGARHEVAHHGTRHRRQVDHLVACASPAPCPRRAPSPATGSPCAPRAGSTVPIWRSVCFIDAGSPRPLSISRAASSACMRKPGQRGLELVRGVCQEVALRGDRACPAAAAGR